MKAITLHQPWATLIMLGYKTYETRSWQTTHRGPVAVHAAKFKSEEYRQLCATDPEISAILAKHRLTYDALPLGALLGTCTVVDCLSIIGIGADAGLWTLQRGYVVQFGELSAVEVALGDYAPDRYAWQLSNVESLVRPLPSRGFQQLWNVAPELNTQMLTREALATALTKRYGGLVQADDIRDFMRLTQPEDDDETLHVQATRDCRTDWYSFTVDGAGRIDYTSITQLPF